MDCSITDGLQYDTTDLPPLDTDQMESVADMFMPHDWRQRHSIEDAYELAFYVADRDEVASEAWAVYSRDKVRRYALTEALVDIATTPTLLREQAE